MTAAPTSLKWAVKESFLAYVHGLSDGAVEIFDGAVEVDGSYRFPGESVTSGVRLFSGGIRFTGFAGMLDVRLADLMIERVDGGLLLSALVGPASIAARSVIAKISAPPPSDDAREWTGTPRLTFEGVRVFGDVYAIDTELAPLVLVEPA